METKNEKKYRKNKSLLQKANNTNRQPVRKKRVSPKKKKGNAQRGIESSTSKRYI